VNDTTAPAKDLGLGDKIEHDLMPGFVMAIKGVGTCETDGARSEPHARYKITDPGGNEDWLCAYDVHPAT
jgi:hypothetical protein